MLSQQQQGLPVGQARITVEQFLQRWLDEEVKLHTRPSMQRGYEQLVRIHLIPGLGEHQLTKLTIKDVENFLGAKRAAGLSAHSANCCAKRSATRSMSRSAGI